MKRTSKKERQRRRRVAVLIIENLLGMAFLLGSLYLFCVFTGFLLKIAGVD